MLNWEEFKNQKVAVHCDTEEKAKQFMSILSENGISDVHDTCWSNYGKDTCYNSNIKNTCMNYSPYDYFLKNGYKMVEFEEVFGMVKSDLRTGMRVTIKDGGVFIVMLNTDSIYSASGDILTSINNGYLELSDYKQDLTFYNSNFSKYDIVKIENIAHINFIFDSNPEYKVVWEREAPPKEMTLEEVNKIIQKVKGFKVKIIE